MKKKLRFLLAIFVFLNFTNIVIAESNFFNEGEKNIKKKSLKTQNFYFKEILSLILKMQNHMYI